MVDEDKPRSVMLNQFIPYRMVNLAKRISDACSEIYVEEFDLSVPEWRVLAQLGETDRQNSRDLGQVTFMDKSKVSRAVKQLDSRGLLHKEKDPKDSRANYLSLTNAGRQLYFEVAPKALEWEAQLISELSPIEYRDLLLTMRKLEVQLDKLAERE